MRLAPSTVKHITDEDVFAHEDEVLLTHFLSQNLKALDADHRVRVIRYLCFCEASCCRIVGTLAVAEDAVAKERSYERGAAFRMPGWIQSPTSDILNTCRQGQDFRQEFRSAFHA